MLNRSPLVSARTRQRVLEAMERLGYRPSPVARAFGRRRTHTIELLVPLFAAPVLVEVLRGLEEELAQTDFTLRVRTAAGPDERERVLDECCASASSEAALLVWMSPTERFIRRMAQQRFPAVVLNGVQPDLWCVSVDHDAAAAQAVTYCLGLGHRRVALVDRPEDPFDRDSRGLCQRGYRQTLAAAGLSVRPEYERLTPFSPAGGSAALAALLDLPEPPSAVVVGSDIQAVGALEQARARARRVPEELSIIGYDDSPFAEYLGLTTLQVPVRELGRQAASTLLGALLDPAAEPLTRYLPTQLLVRGTCAPPAEP